MRSCYVSIPFGAKLSAGIQVLDFDFLYNRVIRPTVEDLGIECWRLDEYDHSAKMGRRIPKSLLGDVSEKRSQVEYFLGRKER